MGDMNNSDDVDELLETLSLSAQELDSSNDTSSLVRLDVNEDIYVD